MTTRKKNISKKNRSRKNVKGGVKIKFPTIPTLSDLRKWISSNKSNYIEFYNSKLPPFYQNIFSHRFYYKKNGDSVASKKPILSKLLEIFKKNLDKISSMPIIKSFFKDMNQDKIKEILGRFSDSFDTEYKIPEIDFLTILYQTNKENIKGIIKEIIQTNKEKETIPKIYDSLIIVNNENKTIITGLKMGGLLSKEETLQLFKNTKPDDIKKIQEESLKFLNKEEDEMKIIKKEIENEIEEKKTGGSIVLIVFVVILVTFIIFIVFLSCSTNIVGYAEDEEDVEDVEDEEDEEDDEKRQERGTSDDAVTHWKKFVNALKRTNELKKATLSSSSLSSSSSDSSSSNRSSSASDSSNPSSSNRSSSAYLAYSDSDSSSTQSSSNPSSSNRSSSTQPSSSNRSSSNRSSSNRSSSTQPSSSNRSSSTQPSSSNRSSSTQPSSPSFGVVPGENLSAIVKKNKDKKRTKGTLQLGPGQETESPLGGKR